MSFTTVVLMFFWLSGLGPDKIDLYSPYCMTMMDEGLIKPQSIESFVDEDHVSMVNAIAKEYGSDPLYEQIYLEFLVYAREFVQNDRDEYEYLLEILEEGAQPL